MSKDLFILISIIFFAAACSTTKPATSGNAAPGNGTNRSSVTFIDNISLTPGSANTDKKNYSTNSTKAGNYVSTPGSIESYSALQFKYAILTNASVEQMNNEKLLDFMDEWYGVPYHYGGGTKDGIDCSAFSSLLMSTVYGVNHLPRVARDQYDQSRRIKKDELQEGDLVFFHTIGKNGRKSITHVGVYLCNNKFVHASLSGVMISDMSEAYYAKHFVGAGRVRD
ncbi:MAG TPA: NlpC/P60 family protein [Puia sp.]|nr:NlpC/P60 family protein [Puia sp.]